jgi:hypothetical protein
MRLKNMYIYILIALELAVLYTVFWYLYIRKPSHRERIVGNPWGLYEGVDTDSKHFEKMTFGGIHDDSLSWLPTDYDEIHYDGLNQDFYHKFNNRELHQIKMMEHAYLNNDLQQVLPEDIELIFDHKTNSYKLAKQAIEGKSLLVKFALLLDRKLSKLNVKP